jgi:hypothetical protein
LRIVFLAGGMYHPMRIPSLQPLSKLERLVKLSLSSVRVADRSLGPLLNLHALRRLDLPLHFPAEDLRCSSARCPKRQASGGTCGGGGAGLERVARLPAEIRLLNGQTLIDGPRNVPDARERTTWPLRGRN